MNIIECNKNLFYKLYKESYAEDTIRFHACIDISDDDAQFFKKIRKVSLFQSLGLKVAVINLNTEKRLVAINGKFTFPEKSDALKIQLLPENPAITIALGSTNFFDIRKNELIRDKSWETIENEKDGDITNLSHVNHDEILEIIEDFSVYEIIKIPFEINDNIDRFLLLLLVTLNIGDPDKLKMKEEILNILTSIENFPHELLHSSFINQTWRHSYIDLYRCIEVLYSIPKMIKLRSSLYNRTSNSENIKNICAIDLFEDVNNSLGWRENEISGLKLLVESTSSENIDKIYDHLKKTNEVDGKPLNLENEFNSYTLLKYELFKDLKSKADEIIRDIQDEDMHIFKQIIKTNCTKQIANFLYGIRNSLVHFRTNQESKSEEVIKVAYKAILIVLSDVFNNYNDEIKSK